MAIKRAAASFVAYVGGVPRMVHVGDLIDETDPIVRGREHLFGDIADHVTRTRPTVEQATAEPGERRSVRTTGRGARRGAQQE